MNATQVVAVVEYFDALLRSYADLNFLVMCLLQVQMAMFLYSTYMLYTKVEELEETLDVLLRKEEKKGKKVANPQV